jgi:LPS export ABC transporter protein LptC
MVRTFVWLMLAHLFITCGSRGESDNSDTTEEVIENEIWNPLIILSREETKIIEAKAEKLYKNLDEIALLVGNVQIDFFSEEGDHNSIHYSDSAQINEQSNNMYAHGNVFVISDSGYTLTTSNILWDNRYKMIIAEDSVMFTTTEGDTMYGVGFESDMDLDQWRIFRIFGVTRGDL